MPTPSATDADTSPTSALMLVRTGTIWLVYASMSRSRCSSALAFSTW